MESKLALAESNHNLESDYASTSICLVVDMSTLSKDIILPA